MKTNAKKSLKLLSFLMVICMMIGVMMPLMPLNVSAAAPTSYTNITTNSTASVSITSSGGAKYFKFVPIQSGTYTFYSTNNSGDPVVELLDASGTQIAYDDDDTDYNFKLSYSCVANTVYYLKARMYGSSETGYYTLNVQTVSTTGTTPTTPITPTGSVVDIAASGAYSLFNSGATSSSGYGRYQTTNPAPNTYNNNGYDLYGTIGSSASRFRLGLSFTVNATITEQATLSIKAYDVDEDAKACGHGYEYDYIYLVDETTGSSIQLDGHMSGQNNVWNTSSFRISPDKIQTGHTYHFEFQMTCTGSTSCFYYSVTVRTVDLVVSGEEIDLNANLSASISSSGLVSASLVANAEMVGDYTLEYKAVYAADGSQKGGKEYTVTIPTQQTSFDTTFRLESGASRGTYIITLFIKDGSGTVKATREYTASYGYSAVSYNANGGSQNLPSDTTTYSSGDMVTVLFDYIPSRMGYTFLGWSTSSTATIPDYTENGTKMFTIGSSDVILYAVWGTSVCEHVWEEASRTDAGCSTYGEVVYTCDCGEAYRELIEPTGHDYYIANTVDATCTTDGYIDFTCANACGATKHQILSRLGHDFGEDNICDRCGFELYSHVHSYVEDIVSPTCTAMGYTEYTCSCGYSYRDNYLEPTRHNWNYGVITIEKTCVSEGLKIYTCLDCSAVKTEIISAGHDWSETVTREKTCTTNGVMTKICMTCGAEETEIIPAGHNWNEGIQTLAPSCVSVGSKTCTCLDCGATEAFEIPELGHNFVNGVCTRCGAKFIDIVTPSTHPLYGMYFEIDDILSDYGPSLVDEYGVMLDYNSGANLEKVAVYLTQDGTMWRRCIAVKGTGITYATYVPYLAYQSDIKYTGLNHDWINIFRLSENSEGIWCYSNYATIGANLQDAYGNLLLSLYDIGQAGAETRIFDDLDEMIAWLNGTCIEHSESEWIVDDEPTCVPGSRHKECTVCGEKLKTEEIAPTRQHTPSGWIVDMQPTATQTGTRHKECTVCGAILERDVAPIVATLVIEDVEAKADSTVKVTINVQNNPGIIGAFLTVNYDPALKLIDAEAGAAWSTLNFTKPSNFIGSCNFVWDGVNGADYSNGTIIVLTFEVPNGADVGTVYNISASYRHNNIINSELEPIDMVIEDGSITVINSIGDVNNDGVINVADVVVLRRYLAGGYGVVIDELAADMDGDGHITVADIVLLRRMLVG